MKGQEFFQQLRHDLPASIVVFFVAMPLCLGIALASGAPLFAGIIAGIVGGIVVGTASGSQVGVSGPAAGLAVIVLSAITSLASYEAFLVAVVLAGLLQMLMGWLRLGSIAYYFPTSVIKGMLTGIGLLIILKQIPHALGYDADYEGDLSFKVSEDENTLSAISHAINLVTPGAMLIAVVSLCILIIWDVYLSKKHRIFQVIQGPVAAVIAGIILHELFISGALPFTLDKSHLVNIPVAVSVQDFFRQFTVPDFGHLSNPEVWLTALIVAVVASIETLLCVEATDKLDPEKRITPTNRELKAQGLGNLVSGLIGGLPVTQVIVRSSTNIAFGGKTKASAVLHGFFLLISAIAIPELINLIPLATLAAILLIVGYKLAKPQTFKEMYLLGRYQFVPFIVTVAGILFTDLLKGIALGMAVGIFYILRNHSRNAGKFQSMHVDGKKVAKLTLADEVSFLNKGTMLEQLKRFEPGDQVIIDATHSRVIDHDVIEIIRDFTVNAVQRNISVQVDGINFARLTGKEVAKEENKPPRKTAQPSYQKP